MKNLFYFFKKYKIKSCKPYNFNNGFAPFYFPIFYENKILNLSKKKFTDILIQEGIPLGWHYGCMVYDWKWAKKYMKDEFKSKNAIYYRDNCFHLYLNENYGVKEATEVVKAIKKIENIYLS